MPSDYVNRDNKKTSPLGAATFLGLRALDPFVQHSILARGTGQALIRSLGSDTFNQGPTSNVGYSFIDGLGLSPYRLALFGMATLSTVKQIFWKLFIGEEEMNIPAAAGIGLFNTFLNSVNSLLFIARATSPAYNRGEGPHWPAWPGLPLAVGGTLFGVGMLWETVAEVQRAIAKRDPKQSGKPYTKGLWALSRHPNYFGYTLWRTGYAIAAGGWIWGLANLAFFTYDFASRGVPVLEEHCETNYADMWHDYTHKTPSKLIPFIY